MFLTSSPAFSTAITLLKAHLQSSNEPITSSSSLSYKPLVLSSKPNIYSNLFSVENAVSFKWRTRVSFFSGFLTKDKDVNGLKNELFDAIAPLDRGAEATPEDQERVDQIALKLEAVNEIKEPLKSNLLNGKWELLYTTSQSILQTKRPKFLRPNGKIYQAINLDSLRAQNMETWPFFNQATANLVPMNARRVAVKFDYFRIAGLIPIKSPGSGRGRLEITYLDEELRCIMLFISAEYQEVTEGTCSF
ncbi:probable plastid-lipid-associated protein 4, chloroplastic isoform X2 [Durio zibethinus]|uniref:Probable plastid-lipid-associated protein 4, chloroplastic isoform X2 n=1 Tax=Durio zibethinus TaxID=66656 RepID=A0A6P5XEG3_DURZI|nr:probable plastid-lipid-associated protein 4, chloroplastic isoform X2 [Durio zibethinus]